MPLQKRIIVLSWAGHLSAPLRELAEIIKQDGNAAAHEEDREFGETEAEQTNEFTEQLLIYEFTLPDRVRCVRLVHEQASDSQR